MLIDLLLIDLLLVLAVLLLVLAVLLQVVPNHRLLQMLPRVSFSKRGAAPASVLPVASVAEPGSRAVVAGRLPGHLAVLTHAELMQVTGAQQLLDHVARHSRLAKLVFERDLLPAVQRYAEFVQLMPASESHHHANVGGLLAHTLETVHHALVLRTGYLLPRNGGAEIIDAQRDYWTYAIFIGALLHDVGKPLTDLRIEMRQPRASEGTRWLPMAGSLNDCKAEQYLVKFAPKGERDYGAHGKLGMVLMQRLVPATSLSFLGRCPDVLQELSQFLNGDAREGVIAEIVAKADQMSTKGNLASGSRARFDTARSVPLVEQLMNAIQEMLRQGGQLPLNRDGAVGWVYDDSVWFVAKRLADTVREFIVARAGDAAGIPGENKNDRLFDCWQEYGQVMPNPQTGQSIWHVTVHGEDGQGYAHELSMLRFPLAKVWPDASNYPSSMAGRIEVRSKRKAEPDGVTGAPNAGAATANTLPVGAGQEQLAGAVVERPTPTASKAAPKEIPAPRFADVAKKAPKPLRAATEEPSDYLPSDETSAAGARAEKGKAGAAIRAMPAEAELADEPQISRRTMPQARTRTEPLASPVVDAASVPADAWSPEDALPASAPIGRVTLHNDLPVAKPAKGAREPSESAVAFMQWLQQGLTEGNLKYNEAGAPVHFVEAGIALVSPAIFRAYAEQFGEPESAVGASAKTGAERVGLSIQREVLRAGWHVPSPADGTNIWTFNVSRRGGVKVSKLSAVVLGDARRWIIEPPPPNQTLQLPTVEAAGSAAS